MGNRGTSAITLLAGLILSLTLPLGAWTQTPHSPQSAGCALEAPKLAPNPANFFSDSQEQDLADALAEYFEAGMKIAAPAADDQLTRIGERLVASLPPTGLHYRFRIYESGEVNGFSIGGGRVYISRKLVAAVANEDELAGVLAHEIGHIATHQTATEFARSLHVRMGINQVTDRADVFARVHQFFSTPEKSGEAAMGGNKDEIMADTVAVYAMVRAGYAPESFPSFLNKITLNKGKTGNWLSDAFGLTHEDSQRFRSSMKLIATLPPECKGAPPNANTAFLAWQKSIVDERVKQVAAGAVGDQSVKLDPPLRPSLWRIRFSGDGRYVLAQDESSIAVLDREKTAFLFRIEAPDAEQAQFTPDSKEVVFHDGKLRIERWQVSTGKRSGVTEMVVLDGCSQTMLSADGRTLICASLLDRHNSLQVALKLIDVESGKAFYDNQSFLAPNVMMQWNSVYMLALDALSGRGPTNMVQSPDGRYVVITVGERNFAFDLLNRVPVSLGGKLKDLVQARMSFLGPDQLFVAGEFKGNGLFKANVLSFPDGRLVKETVIGSQSIESVTKGQKLIVFPVKDYAVAVLDPVSSQLVTASKLFAIDTWDSVVAIEDSQGGVSLGKIGSPELTKIPLAIGPLPRIQSGIFSPDGKFLAVSVKNRAEIWNLETGKQMGLYRPFRSAWVDDENHLYIQMTKYLDHDPGALKMNLGEPGATDLGKYENKEWQYHDLQYTFKPMGKGKSESEHATLEVKPMGAKTATWTRDFPHETPACWPAEDNRLVLGWDLGTDGAKAEMKAYPALQKEADSLKDRKRGLLLETIDPATGKPYQQVIVPEADLTHGWDDVRIARVSGDFVLVRGEHDTTVIYRTEDGSKVGEFFGQPLATDAASGVVAAENRDDEILFVDERTGKELQRFTLGSTVRLARIVNAGEKQLLVLTADQVVHRLPLPKP